MKSHSLAFHALGLNRKKIMMKNRMKLLRKCLLLSALVLPLCWSSSANAESLAPTNYVATPGEGTAQGGYYNYFDDTGSQLTDGQYGVNNWSANLGDGIAYEWVGWRVADPTITFQFAEPVTINQVGIDFNRNESDMIFLPSTVQIDDTDFALNPNAISNDTRGTLFFNGNWTGTTLTMNLEDCSTSDWIFVDEIVFNGVNGTTTVPEPSAFMLLAAGLGLLLLHMKHRLNRLHVSRVSPNRVRARLYFNSLRQGI
jgi:PEP-CTERM motif